MRILTIGKGTQDVFVQSQEFDPHTKGNKLYTHLPLGIKMEAENVTFSTGGNATNVATTLARQGINTSYMWSLGEDSASQAVLNDLDNESVDTSLVVQDEKYQAGYSVILIATNGERTIINHRGRSCNRFGHHSLDLGVIADFDWVYPSSLGDDSLKILRDIIEVAEKNDTKVMLNPAGTELSNIDKLVPLLEGVEILCANREEMKKIVSGETCEELALHALNYVPVAIVSDGPNGVVATDGKTLIRAGMYEDVKVVDRTGAGDAFASGFLSQWSRGKSLRDSAIFASANSTSVVTKIGAKAGILHKNVKLHEMPIYERKLKSREAKDE